MTTPMNAPLETRAELMRWQRLLDLSKTQRDALAGPDAAQLKRLRGDIETAVFERRRPRFKRLARLVGVFPAGTLARLAQHSFGPRLAGRLVGEMDTLRAVKVAKRLPAAFIADAAPEIDPARVRPIVAQLPAELVRDAALVLIKRDDPVVLGRFADALSAPAIRAVVDAVDDDATLLHIAFAMTDKTQLTRIVQLIDNDRVARIMRTGTTRELWPEALSIVDNVDTATAGRLAGLMAEQDTDTLDDLVTVADRQALWPPVLRAIKRMDARYHRKIVNLPALRDEALLGRLIVAAHEHGLLDIALPLTAPMRADAQRAVAHAALRQDDEIADAVLWAAHRAGAWREALTLAAHLDDAERDRLSQLPALTQRRLLATLLESATQTGHTALVHDVVDRMTGPARQQVATAVVARDGETLGRLIERAENDADWALITTIVGALDEENDRQTATDRIQARGTNATERFKDAAIAQNRWQGFAPLFDEPAA
ncbi:hypothetical protein J7355_07920 [Endozoicomonas sp. G2_2]|uniref:hypothetical protein n=1 Tax=Endozoicomonas sp. G2_2 TaxID=2821092 RepID=UPI001ADD4FBA|nr:hypothetical protein [Endozoicomonas sp. G2_2]MBO9470023.1 hypothetical protein [Endozoicomonas sp. G2_2]